MIGTFYVFKIQVFCFFKYQRKFGQFIFLK